MISVVSQPVLEQAHCWFPRVDVVAGQPEVTEFKQRARLHQCRWRESRHYPEGSKPYRPEGGDAATPVGSRLEYAFAKRERKNLLSDGARAAASDRLANRQAHQTLNEQRLWCDLLSSMPLCFNLFGPLAADPGLAKQVIPIWFPDLPGTVSAVHLEWSPGRATPGRFLENRTAFDVAVELDLGYNRAGVLGIETKYHEHAKAEKRPTPKRLQRYREVTIRSGVFKGDAVEQLLGSPQQQLWQDHLLALSMLDEGWDWARFVVVHPEGNQSFANASSAYAAALEDLATFDTASLEYLLVESDALPQELRNPLSERYLW